MTVIRRVASDGAPAAAMLPAHARALVRTAMDTAPAGDGASSVVLQPMPMLWQVLVEDLLTGLERLTTEPARGPPVTC